MPAFTPSPALLPITRVSVSDMDQHGSALWTYNRGASLGSGALGTNLITYIPFLIPATVTVYRLWWMSIGTAAGNYDMGIYTETGTRLASLGSTASTLSGQQMVYADIPDTTIGRGVYFVALALSSGSQSVMRWALANGMQRSLILYVQATFTLPATATFSTNNTTTALPMVGMDLRGY
jgi:hypothetical protein